MTETKTRYESKVIGYWMSERKTQKLNWSEFASVCRRYGFSLVKLNLDKPLEAQGPFTLILHKLTEIIAQTIQGNSKAVAMIEQVESYIENHPEVVVIDPLNNVRKLLDRYVSYRIIHDSNLEEIDVFTPAFVELTTDDVQANSLKLRNSGVKYPFVCKMSVAQGMSDCHKRLILPDVPIFVLKPGCFFNIECYLQYRHNLLGFSHIIAITQLAVSMSIIFNEAGLVDCKPPCVAQTFINHNAVLFKIYVLGDDFKVVERPSLKNFYPSDRASIFFDSHDVSKPDSTSSLSILDPDDLADGKSSVAADPVKLAAIVRTVREKLGMDLLGIDVVVENNTGRHAVIDINAYPGYDGYPNFFESLMNCILKRISDHKAELARQRSLPSDKEEEKTKVDQDDSGFDTSDSSDEKKRKQRLRYTIGSGGRASANQVMSKKHVERQH